MQNIVNLGKRGQRTRHAWRTILMSAPVVSLAACAQAQTTPTKSASTKTPPQTSATTSTKSLTWQTLNEPGSGGAMTAISVSPFDSKRVLIAGDMLGVGLSTDRGDSWQPTFGLKTWEMSSFTWHPTDPNVVWVGSMGGPYKSSDGGKNWTLKRKGMPALIDFGYSAPVEQVLFDPANPKRLLAYGGSSRHWSQLGSPAWGVIWESRDGGENWSRFSTITAEGSSTAPDAKGDLITFMAYAPGSKTRMYAASDKAGFLASDDGGKTWTRRVKGLPPAGIEYMWLAQIAMHPKNPNTLWAAVDNHLPAGSKVRVPGGVYKTTDGGLNWFNSSKGMKLVVQGDDYNLTSHTRALAVSPVDGNILFCSDHAWSTGIIYKSEDGGANWRAVASKTNLGSDSNDPSKKRAFQLSTAMPAGLGLGGLAFDPKDARVAFGYNTEFIARTLDGGRTWNDSTSFQPAGKTGWRGRGYSGWVSINFAFNPFKAGQSVFQAMDAARLWISDDDLSTWRYPLGAPDAWNGGRAATFARDGRIYATTGTYNFTGVARSTDGGKTWETLNGTSRGLPDFYKGKAPGGIYALPDDGKKVWAVIDGKLMASQDGGESWKVVLDKPGLQWIAADPKTPKRFYISGERDIYQTDDGQKFTAIGGPRNNGPLAVDSQGRVLSAAIQSERGGLWRYDPKATSGTRWKRLLDEHWIGGVAVDPTNAQRIAISTNQNPYSEYSKSTGVWISGDGGRSWSQQNKGLAMLRGLVVAFDPHAPERLVFGSYGRGYFQTNWPKSFVPKGERAYISTAEDARFAAVQVSANAAGANVPDGINNVIRDFGGVDYTFGPDWKNGENVKVVGDALQLDTTEAGGAGLVLGGLDIAPQKQTHLAIRARVLSGNAAKSLIVNLLRDDSEGGRATVTFDLSKLKSEWTTLREPLGAGTWSKVNQIQIQGANWSPNAPPLKIQIDSLGTTSLSVKTKS